MFTNMYKEDSGNVETKPKNWHPSTTNCPFQRNLLLPLLNKKSARWTNSGFLFSFFLNSFFLFFLILKLVLVDTVPNKGSQGNPCNYTVIL